MTNAPLRLILDTNVVLDLLYFSDAPALPILSALEARIAQCYASEETLEELRRVLTYAAFSLDEKKQVALHARYQALTGLAKLTPANGRMPRCNDPDDQMFLELAASAQADLLVSKDKALLALKHSPGLTFNIVSPTEACGLLSSIKYGDHLQRGATVSPDPTPLAPSSLLPVIQIFKLMS